MSDFRTREAARVFGLRQALFTPPANASLERDQHHLGEDFAKENLYVGIRDAALEFFAERRIKWHGGGGCDKSIVSSQVACLNCLFPFVSDAATLKAWASRLYPDLAEVLPISSSREPPRPDGRHQFVTFEWIGERNYLNERPWGSRGQYCTSVDWMFRYRTVAGGIHVVLSEWKYCERYAGVRKYIHSSDSGTDRVAIYRPQLSSEHCQLQLGEASFEDLFFEPFYQLMRLQLLASAMEGAREMGADTVSVLYVSPGANDGLLNPSLASKVAPGQTISDIWSGVVAAGRFKAISTEELVQACASSSTNERWSAYVSARYGSMA